MVVYVFTKNTTALKKKFPKHTQFLPLTQLSNHSPQEGSSSYIDITGLAASNIKNTLAQLIKICRKTPWGIIDPKGSIKDPAALFFEGACDYLGPAVLKKSVEPERLKKALVWRNFSTGEEKKKNEKTAENANFLKNGIKLPAANVFPGWKKMQSGKVMPFYLLLCSLQAKTALDSRLGEKTFAQIHKRFLALLASSFAEADGLLWMDTGKDCFFLLPPKIKSVEAAVEACLRMIISAPLITLESLGLSIPVNFIFTLHYGSISYKPPGKTGTVLSDAVNFIFHLRDKKAQSGRLTISGDLPDASIPEILQDLFIPSCEFEGRKVWHTKKYNYANHWV